MCDINKQPSRAADPEEEDTVQPTAQPQRRLELVQLRILDAKCTSDITQGYYEALLETLEVQDCFIGNLMPVLWLAGCGR